MPLKNVKIGPAGWHYPDWDGPVYPKNIGRSGFSKLSFIAGFFNVVEVNTSFYQPLRPSAASSWVNQVRNNKYFTFTLKLWQIFTHTDTPVNESEKKIFLEGMAPLLDAGMLGAVLAQFPWRFKNEPGSQDQLKRVLASFEKLPMVVEFRHSSWLTPEILRLLTNHNAGFANIDQPVIGRSIHPTNFVSSKIGYVRFHGRNYDTWFVKDGNRDARYNYLYSDNELALWIDRIKYLSEKTEAVFVIFNNHYRGQAIANSFQLAVALEGIKPVIPENIINAFPFLSSIAQSVSRDKKSHYVQGDLFNQDPLAND